MKTSEVIKLIMKGSEIYKGLTQKQYDWICNAAKSESRLTTDGFELFIGYTNCYFKLRQCKRLASGGSYVGSAKIQGRYIIEKYYAVQHKDTGNIEVGNTAFLNRLDDNNYSYTIINPIENNILAGRKL